VDTAISRVLTCDVEGYEDSKLMREMDRVMKLLIPRPVMLIAGNAEINNLQRACILPIVSASMVSVATSSQPVIASQGCLSLKVELPWRVSMILGAIEAQYHD
jgi:hypothetical protein